MAHRSLAFLALPLALLASGCCHCAAPYDYCQPTFLAMPDEHCQPDARMNSVFNPMQVAAAGPIVTDGPAIENVAPPSSPRKNETPRAPNGEPMPGLPMQAPHAEIQTSAIQAIPVSQEAGRRPLQLRR